MVVAREGIKKLQEIGLIKAKENLVIMPENRLFRRGPTSNMAP